MTAILKNNLIAGSYNNDDKLLIIRCASTGQNKHQRKPLQALIPKETQKIILIFSSVFCYHCFRDLSMSISWWLLHWWWWYHNNQPHFMFYIFRLICFFQIVHGKHSLKILLDDERERARSPSSQKSSLFSLGQLFHTPGLLFKRNQFSFHFHFQEMSEVFPPGI